MKRVADFLLSLVILIGLLPVFAVIALLVRTILGSPVLFRQTRTGWHGRLFQILKFRTMAPATTSGGELLPDAQRLNDLGRWLRKTSLDELPSLINVLRGDMSLVGPRPLLPQYLPLYDSRQARRHEVRPGITGWAQVNGRNALTWEQKFEHDVWYVDHQSLLLDVRILALTVLKVLKREGISQHGHVTAEPFRGSN